MKHRTLSALAALAALTLAPRAHAAPAAPAAPAAAPATAPADLDALLAAFRALPGLEARFTEDKHLALLAAPLRSEGTLRFAPPGHLRRDITAPRPTTLVITPDALHVTEAGATETIDLRARKDVRLFVESLVWILAGDRDRLTATYTLDHRPDPHDPARWTLTLTPRVAPLSDIIATIRLTGAALIVDTIEVTETNGDRTLTRITHATPRPYTPAERATLFTPPAP